MPDLTRIEQRVTDEIARRGAELVADLELHVNIPTGPGAKSGLDESRERFTRRLAALGATVRTAPGDPKETWLYSANERPGEIPPTAICRRGAPHESEDDAKARILLCGHLDTVHEQSSPFRTLTISPDGKTATGPGCVDMKGGLVIAIAALEALEACGVPASWGFILNSDEETGSYHSDRAMQAEARNKYDVALVFEPAMADGGLVIERPGSGQFMIEVRGRAGHVGRDFKNSVSAVTALAKCLTAVAEMADPDHGAITNIGPIRGGTATNIVPDHAAAWGNVRFESPAVAASLGNKLDALASHPNVLPLTTIRRSFHRPAKPLTPATQRLAEMARVAAEDLGQRLPFGKTGGVCDGNNLQAAGLPTIDTLGVRGGGLHTIGEWIEILSLVERCQLLAVLMVRLTEQGFGERQ